MTAMRCLLIPLLVISFSVQAQLPDPVLTPKERRAIAEALAARIETSYVLETPARKMAAKLREHIARGDYDAIESAESFSETLTRDVRAVNDDRHFRVAISSAIVPPADADPRAVPQRNARYENDVRRENFGVESVRRLDGNVGYLDLTLFPPAEVAAPTYDAAMAVLGGTDALIIDTRGHRGGDPGMVQYLVSYFVPEGTPINAIYHRETGETKQYAALKVNGKRYDRKVYVLTSRRTFSGGEELAYDLQALGRAKLFGEVTGGGAHPTRPYRIHERFLAFIPYKQSINPVTKTNWEGVGVNPDVAAPAADALRLAHTTALQDLIGGLKADDPWRGVLEKRLAAIASSNER